jgi:hypothetical protein
MTTREVAQQLVDLCRKGQNQEAIQSLYHPDCKSIEAMPDPQGKQEFQGMDTILGRNQWWGENHEVHSAEIGDPLVSPGHFAVHFKYDVTSKPMDNQRMTLDEIGVYEVQDGKIVKEQFFYSAM